MDEAKKFQEYKAWQKHVENFLNDCDNDNLSEFYHFIRSNARLCNNIREMYTYFAIPFLISVITGGFISRLFDTNFYNAQIQSSYLEVAILIAIYFFAAAVIIMIIAIPFIFLLKDYINTKNETVFWEDYLEIIETEMKKQKEKNSKNT